MRPTHPNIYNKPSPNKHYTTATCILYSNYSTCITHSSYMYFTQQLHVLYTAATCIIHSNYMYFIQQLHVFYTAATCVLYSSYMYFIQQLHVFYTAATCMHVAQMLYSPPWCKNKGDSSSKITSTTNTSLKLITKYMRRCLGQVCYMHKTPCTSTNNRLGPSLAWTLSTMLHDT